MFCFVIYLFFGDSCALGVSLLLRTIVNIIAIALVIVFEVDIFIGHRHIVDINQQNTTVQKKKVIVVVFSCVGQTLLCSIGYTNLQETHLKCSILHSIVISFGDSKIVFILVLLLLPFSRLNFLLNTKTNTYIQTHMQSTEKRVCELESHCLE